MVWGFVWRRGEGDAGRGERGKGGERRERRGKRERKGGRHERSQPPIDIVMGPPHSLRLLEHDESQRRFTCVRRGYHAYVSEREKAGTGPSQPRTDEGGQEKFIDDSPTDRPRAAGLRERPAPPRARGGVGARSRSSKQRSTVRAPYCRERRRYRTRAEGQAPACEGCNSGAAAAAAAAIATPSLSEGKRSAASQLVARSPRSEPGSAFASVRSNAWPAAEGERARRRATRARVKRAKLFHFDRRRGESVVVVRRCFSPMLSSRASSKAWDGSRGLQLRFQGYLRVVISLELAEKSAKEGRRRATRG